MSDELSDMTLAAADQLARERIEAARADMSRWRLLRARRLAEARASGMRVEEIAEEIGVSVPTVYEVLRAAKKPDA